MQFHCVLKLCCMKKKEFTEGIVLSDEMESNLIY
jgi:hypothetical protein